MKNIKFLAIIAIAISALSLSACTKQAPKSENVVSYPDTQGNVSPLAQDTPVSDIFRISDVAMHASKDDCWTVIEGGVYDLTAYIASGQHKPVIVKGCGVDSTNMFNNVGKHGNSDIKNMLVGMKIGTLTQ